MLPRFRYGKLIILGFVALCFILYMKCCSDTPENENFDHFLARPNALQADKGKFPINSAEDENLNEIVKNVKQQEEEPPKEKDDDNNDNDSNNLDKGSEYELSIRLDLEKQVPGLGDFGEPVILEGDAKDLGDAIYKKIALNEELSERLSYTRTLPDSRHPACALQQIDKDNLPSASVIIIFYNEPYSVLVRTIHSTLTTCYDKSLKQIILVDDGSTNVELHGKLDYYIKSRITNGKVQVLRLKNRLGLIRARLAGARIATGDVLIFLDAHCEANIGWCEPLLQRIKESRTNVLVPIIDVIDAKDFQYSTNGYKSFQVGGFDWTGHFDWVNLPKREKERQLRECSEDREICPARSPTMAGGLFAIDRRYFWEIGSYDEQMDGWGGENLEMSFRIWQCGGTIETIPCSRVGHVFRDFHPYSFPNDRDTHGINTARMALVWMDDYINIFFLNRPDLKFHPDIGDVTHRVMLRKKLRCKNFDWYLKNIYPEKFVPTKNVIAYGRIKSSNTNLCLDDLLQSSDKPFNMGVFSCGKILSRSQFFSYTNNRVLRNEQNCATVKHSKSVPHLVVMVPCLENDDYNEKWSFENSQLQHIDTGLCLDHRGLKNMDEVQVAPCVPYSETQKWIILHD